MQKHKHRFVEEYTGLIGFGLDRITDEASLVVYLQKFSDDAVMAAIKHRLSDSEINEAVDFIFRLMKKHLNEDEYHRLFLKDGGTH